MSISGQKLDPDISISIHGSAPGTFPHFRKNEDILDGEYYHIYGSRGSITMSCLVYYHDTGYGQKHYFINLQEMVPHVKIKAT